MKKKSPRRPTRKHAKSPEPTQAIVRVAAPIEKPWELDDEQTTILKNAVAKGASNEELKYCLTVARRYRLDPFKRQIWFVSRWDKNADNGKGGTGAFVWTPTVGIDGLLFMSARDHHVDFGSISLPEYGPMYTPEGANFKAPEWAKVKVFKKGVTEPTEAIAYFDEYCPSDFSKAPFWRKMPRRMIGKCASALALRQAYPDLGGLYIPEECERIAEDYTSGGRQIIEQATQGTPLGTKAAAQAVLEAKLAGRMPLNPEIVAPEPPKAPDPLSWKKEAENHADEAAKPKSAKKEPPKPIETKYELTIDWNLDRNMPVLTGDIEQLGWLLTKATPPLKMVWKDEFWKAEAKDVPAIMQVASQNAFLVKEIQINQVSSAGHSQGRSQAPGAPPAQGKPEAKRGSGSSTRPATSASGSVLVCGVIERVTSPTTSKGQPMRQVTILVDSKKPTFGCFQAKLFVYLDAGKGAIEALTTTNGKYLNLVGLKRIVTTKGVVDFDEDGITPVVQRNREAGTPPSLFNE